MIDESTIKSLYNDKPTLMEWLKRVEEQLEEVKKLATFGDITADNVTAKGVTADKLTIKHGAEIDGDFEADTINAVNGLTLAGGELAPALYIHKLALSYATTSHEANFFVAYISSKPEGYSSMAELFEDRSNTTLSLFEKAEYTRMDGAFIEFSATGDVLKAAGISMVGTSVVFNVLINEAFSFVSDEVVGRWAA